jgi:hypothetical protein
VNKITKIYSRQGRALKMFRDGGANSFQAMLKEGPLTKNGPIDFAQSWAILMKKSN